MCKLQCKAFPKWAFRSGWRCDIKKLTIENHCYDIWYYFLTVVLERDKQTRSMQVNNFPAKVFLENLIRNLPCWKIYFSKLIYFTIFREIKNPSRENSEVVLKCTEIIFYTTNKEMKKIDKSNDIFYSNFINLS